MMSKVNGIVFVAVVVGHLIAILQVAVNRIHSYPVVSVVIVERFLRINQFPAHMLTILCHL